MCGLVWCAAKQRERDRRDFFVGLASFFFIIASFFLFLVFFSMHNGLTTPTWRSWKPAVSKTDAHLVIARGLVKKKKVVRSFVHQNRVLY